MRRSPLGTWTRRACAWALGEAPTARFVDPWLADRQAECADRGDPGLAGRARMAVELARMLPVLVARAEADGALGSSWPVVALLAVGLGALASTSPSFAAAQAEWAGLGLVAMLGLRLLPRFVRVELPSAAGAAGLALAAIGPALASQRWVHVSSLFLWWSALARPLLLVSLAALSSRARGPDGARYAWAAAAVGASACASLVVTQEPGPVAVTVAMVLGVGLASGRVAHLPTFAAVAVGALCFWLAIPPWGLGWLHRAATDESLLRTDLVLVAASARWGLAGAALGLAASVAVALVPIRATRAESAQLLAWGFAASQGAQVVLHAGAASGLLPALELPLPGLSYGGSSLVALLATLGYVGAVDVSARRALAGSA